MKIKPLNMKKYIVNGHQLEDISRVGDAFATLYSILEEEYPDDAHNSIAFIASMQLDDILNRIEENQEIVGGHQITVSIAGQEADG